MPINYADAGFPVRSEFAESHERFWQRLQTAGCWYTAEQRVAIAEAVRQAESCSLCNARKQALSPRSVDGTHDGESILPDTVIEAVHSIVRDASRINRSWYNDLLERGLTPGQYIEVVGTVVAMVSIDSFADAIGVTRRALPPVDSTDSAATVISGYKPATAGVTDQAWVPMVPEINEGTPEADLWPSGKTGNVVRAMSLVPDEVRSLKDLSAAHYLPMSLVRQAGVDAGRALHRSQMELVAGRVSALNACYY
ncbi:hypothetical protein AB833_19280 [Chromatiales bacterium (ex Bugula neritina AB1)]|nr:hypothetical protein AB833_19280 [Chromatiales bacterium (ex Bugula neritina AB1)]